jgi:hypothetical protein
MGAMSSCTASRHSARGQRRCAQRLAGQAPVQPLRTDHVLGADPDQRMHLAQAPGLAQHLLARRRGVQHEAQVLGVAFAQRPQFVALQRGDDGAGPRVLPDIVVEGLREALGSLAQQVAHLPQQLRGLGPVGIEGGVLARLGRLTHAELPPAPALLLARLDLIQRGVGLAQQGVAVGAVGGEGGQAHAGLHRGAEREGTLHRAVQAPQQPAELARLEFLDHHDEFVPAQARQEVAFAQQRAQALRDFLQQAVAGVVAEAVVDRLEIVQVEHSHRDRPAVAPGVRSVTSWKIRSEVSRSSRVRHTETSHNSSAPSRRCTRTSMASALPCWRRRG